MCYSLNTKVIKAVSLCGLLLALSNLGYASNDVSEFIENFEKNDKQTVLVGHIDSLAIIRGNAEFHLTDGELTLFDFGWDKPSAMVFDGTVKFKYSPPDEIERYQLHKFTGKDTLEGEFESIVFFFTIELENLPDTTSFVRQKVERDPWRRFQSARKDAFNHLDNYLPNSLLGDLLSDGSGSYFYADFYLSEFEHLVFRENPYKDDQFRLYKLRADHSGKYADVYCGSYPDNKLVSNRGVLPIDLEHYDLDIDIARSGDMDIKCRVNFNSLRSNRKFIYFHWIDKNELKLATDSNGDTLKSVFTKDEFGLGLVLNKSLEIGQSDYIDISYKSESLVKAWGTYYFRSQTYWYPRNHIMDAATYDITYKFIEDFTLISCGEKIDSKTENGVCFSRWQVKEPVNLISFNIGLFNNKEFKAEKLEPITLYYSKEVTRKEIIERTGEDIINSFAFFTDLLGPCPFKNLKATEIPYFHGQGSPGLIHLTWASMRVNIWTVKGTFEMFRAHEVSHQWWGHVVDYENYRDTWILEGLAEYCGFIYYQSVSRDNEACNNILYNWRIDIISGSKTEYSKVFDDPYLDFKKVYFSEGSKAGPVVLGYRLSSSKSKDYGAVVYIKGAYIFHMIRYLMHDFNTDSDDRFIAFLRDMLDKYKDKPITTEAFQQLLEEHVQTDMGWFFDQWVYGIHIPDYEFSYKTVKTPDGKYQVTCHVKQENVPDGFMMPVPIRLDFGVGKFANLRILVNKLEQDIPLPVLPMEPENIEFNINDAVLCRVK